MYSTVYNVEYCPPVTSPVAGSITAPSVGWGSKKAKVPPGVFRVVTSAPSHVGVISKKESSPSSGIKINSAVAIQFVVV